jgi:PAS domain S-box-containing protein
MNKFSHFIIKSTSKYWLSFLVALILLTVTIFLWRSLRAQESEYVQKTVSVEAESIEKNVELEMRERLLALQRMADRWAKEPDGTSRAAWNNDAQNYYSDFKGFQAVEWIDKTYHIRWLIPAEGNEAAQNIDLANLQGWREILDKAGESGKGIILHKTQLAQGGHGLLALSPIDRGENFKGFIGGVFRVEKLFSMIINPELAEKYNIEITQGTEIIYRHGKNFDGSNFTSNQAISFTNANWQMAVSPNETQIAALKSLTDEIVFIAGLCFSLLLSLAIYLAQRARLKTKQLRDEMDSRRKIQNEQKRLIAILDASEDFIGVMSADGTPIYNNKAGRKMIGLGAETDLSVKTFTEIHPQWAMDLIVTEAIPAAVKNGVWIGETAFLGETGKEIPVSQMLLSHKNEHGELQFISTVARDISLQKQTEIALRKSENLYRQLTEKSQGLICTHDLEGNLLTVNNAAAASLGYQPDELIGRNISEFLTPRYREFFNPHINQIIAEGKSSGVFFITSKDGSEKIWQFSNTLDKENGKPYILGYAQDITGLKAAEGALRESEERLKLFVEHTPTAVAMFDLEMKYVLASRCWLTDYKLGDQEIIGRSHYEVFPDISEKSKEIHQRCLKGEVMKGDEDPFPRADGTLEWLKWEIRPWRDNHGEIGGVIFFTEVITERKNMQQLLEETASMQKAILNSANYSVISTSTDGTIKSFNKTAEKMLGYSANELIGKVSPAIIHDLDEVIARAEELSEEFGYKIEPGFEVFVAKSCTQEVEEREWTYVRKDGSRFPVMLSITAIRNEKGEITDFLGIANDISIQKETQKTLRESEDRFRTLVNHSPVGIFRTEVDGKCIFVNEQWCKLTGLTPEEAFGEGWARAIPTEDREEVFRIWQETTQTGGNFTLQMRFQTPEGIISNVLSRAVPQLNDAGEITGYLGTVVDITEITQLQAELKQTRDAAIESARLKSEFLANMSHEIRTPMNGVIGMTDLLLDTDLSTEQFEFTETIKTSADALLTVINDILDFSKIEAGKLNIEIIDFNLLHLVENVVELFADQSQRKEIELSSLIESNVSFALLGDPGRIRQVLTNLIGNAVKFTEKGDVSVRVSKLSETDEKIKIRFSVKDSGIGISEKAQKYLFQAFTQADGSTTRKYGGTGLGLAISNQLVEMMNGELNVVSQEGKGSEFSFTLELEKQPEDQIKEVNKLSDLENLRVLIVDDNPTNRKILSHQTKSWGMKPQVAENGIIALEMLKMAAETDESFELAILDVMMPIISGFDVAKLIKDEPLLRNLKLIIMPSYGQRGDGQKARELGINGYLLKPVKQSNLFDCIATVMGENMNFTTETPHKPLVTKHSINENQFRSQQRILLAEDNEINQRVTRQQLEKSGFLVDVVADGNQALLALSNQNYSLVLMDCQMPVMDGYTATAEIRRRETGSIHMPVVALTAHAIEGEREKCISAGMDDYISKPFKKELLIETIERNIKLFANDELLFEDSLESVDISENQLVDLETLKEITDLDAEMMHEMVEMYIEQTDQRIRDLTDALEVRDFEQIYRLAHTSLGSSATLGMTAMVEPFRNLETAGKENDLEAAKRLIVQLPIIYSKLSEYLKDLS